MFSFSEKGFVTQQQNNFKLVLYINYILQNEVV